MEAGVAVRLPRGADRRRRQPRRVRDRRPVVHRRAHAPGRDQGVLQRLPAPRPRQLKDHGGRCSEFRCPFHGFTWALDGALRVDPGAVGLRARRRTTSSRCPRRKVGTWGGFVFINPDPEAGAARRLPRRPAQALRALEARGPLHPGPRPEGHPGQLEDRPGGVLRVVPRGRPRTRRPLATSATSTARSTSGTTSPG